MIPGVGTPLKRYFMKFESSQTAIDSIVKSLEKGREQLKRDNVTLSEDQRAMRELTRTLTEQIELDFREDGIRTIAELAARVNERSDDIGARRLHTLMEKLLEDISFEAPDLGRTKLVIDEAHVRKQLESLVEDEDLSRFIL